MAKKLLWIYLIGLIFISQSIAVRAAEKPISGTVLDFETKEPIPYTNIGVLGKPKGTISNEEGKFVLDMEGVTLSDSVQFHSMGYETLRIKVSELLITTVIYLKPTVLMMREIKVVPQSVSAENIVKLAYKNFEKNHVVPLSKQRIFFHKYGKVPLSKTNQLVLKESDFVGLDKKTFDDLMKKIPSEFIDYQDAIVELYKNGSGYKMVPVKAISLEEGSQQTLMKEVESSLSGFFDDINKSMNEKDIYYKFRSGIISRKIGNTKKEKAEWNEAEENVDKDTLNYTVETADAKNYLLQVLKNYTQVESDNWEFINSTGKYKYTVEAIEYVDEEMVYKISFKPEKKGLYEGMVYISSESYAILQLDFAFAKGKQSNLFNMFGFKHATNFREAHIIFEKRRGYYPVKYLYIKQKEFSSIDRDFVVIKKQKRFLFDKDLNEMKFEAELSFNTESQLEVLVLGSEEISAEQYEKIKEPEEMKFSKQYAYSPEMWENRTIIVPGSELQKYKRK